MADESNASFIGGYARTVREMFTGRKYGLEYYQREYTWSETNVSELLDDLTTAFLERFDEADERRAVASYPPYFLGPVVTSRVGSMRYLVDGQQRLTTLTLLLIHLHQLADGRDDAENLASLVFSQQFGQMAFNIDVDEREPVMTAILNKTSFDSSAANESCGTIWDRHIDLVTLFPAELSGTALLHFTDWLLERVVLVEIETTDHNMALTMFETMNDRGQRLSNTDMLKSFLIARVGDDGDIAKANQLWRARIEDLNTIDRNADAEFIKSWLRGKYADTIRERKKDAAPGDFDLIATAFHKWVRDHKERLDLRRASDFARLVNHDFDRLSRRYQDISHAATTYTPGLEAVFFNSHNSFTLQMLPIMAAITPDDTNETFRAKTQLVASYLDLFLARRMANSRSLGYSTLVYTMFNLAKDLRDKDIDDLRSVLADRVASLEENFDEITTLTLNQRNRGQVAYLLARMTAWLEEGHGVGFAEYVSRSRRNPFEVEHIWANHADQHTDEFTNERDFADKRNRLGGLLLLPKDFNASYGDKPYSVKLPLYFGQNVLAQSLHPNAYVHNPTFLALTRRTGLPFTAYPDAFTGRSIDQRQDLYRLICEEVWSPDALGLGGGSPIGDSKNFYVSFGHGPHRDWEDARRYGFISAGGGRWYTQSLTALKTGDRVFVYIPAHGYVGVGVVRETVKPLSSAELTVAGEKIRFVDLPLTAIDALHDKGDTEHEEHVVGIEWQHTRPIEPALRDPALFANQHSACRLRDETTIDRVLLEFGLTGS